MSEKNMPVDENGDEEIEDVPAFKRKRVVLPLLIAISTVAVGAYFWSINAMRYIDTNDAMVETDRVTVSSKILGRITRMRVTDGDTVRPGDTLLILDDADLKVQEQKISAAVSLQTCNADVAHEGVNRAQQEADRATRQLSMKIIPQDQYDHAMQALSLARAQSKAATAQIAAAGAEHAVVKAQLANTIVFATDTGVIAKHWVQPGDVVAPGQAVYTIFKSKNCWVTAWFEETKLRFVNVGQTVQVTADAYPGVVYKGVIERIGESTAAQFSVMPPSNASGNFTKITQRVAVKIKLSRFPAGSRKLIPGLSVTAKVQIR